METKDSTKALELIKVNKADCDSLDFDSSNIQNESENDFIKTVCEENLPGENIMTEDNVKKG